MGHGRLACAGMAAGAIAAVGCATAPRLADAPFQRTASAAATVLAAEPVAQPAPGACGAAALATVLGYWGRPADGLPAPGAAGASAGELAAAGRAQGLGAACFTGTPDDLVAHVDRGRPVLVLLPVNDGRLHWCVVAGHDAASGDLVFADPARGWRRAGRAAFDRAWAASGRCALLVAPVAAPAAEGAAMAPPGGTPLGQPVTAAEWASLATRATPGLAERRGGEAVTIDFQDPDFWWGAGIFGGGVFVIMLIVVIAVA